MQTFFINEYANFSLPVLNVGDAKAISISSSWNSCDVDTNYSWYFECSDSRLSSNANLNALRSVFKLDQGSNYYILKVRSCCVHVTSLLYLSYSIWQI